jgi:hypothetical protein
LYTNFSLSFEGLWPHTLIFQSVCCKIQVKIFIVVDLPAPFGHKKAIFSHELTSKLISETASMVLYSGLKKAFTLFLNQFCFISILNIFLKFFISIILLIF